MPLLITDRLQDCDCKLRKTPLPVLNVLLVLSLKFFNNSIVPRAQAQHKTSFTIPQGCLPRHSRCVQAVCAGEEIREATAHAVIRGKAKDPWSRTACRHTQKVIREKRLVMHTFIRKKLQGAHSLSGMPAEDWHLPR